MTHETERKQALKITLTSAQVQEIRTKAQAEQDKAYKAYLATRDTYNRVLSLGSSIEIADLAALMATLPDQAPAPVTATVAYPSQSKRYFAYSRTQRREPNGALAVHDITVNMPGNLALCACPGFANHGHCWASDEAILLNKDALRKSGNNGVYRRS